jgi:serine phosphatase RsbU (regulator of sigma subunit)/transcriptional regulator with GAF, ATPase, and Fis domain
MQADELHPERLRLAERAGSALAESLDVTSALQRLGEVLVPALADWFAVDLLDGDEIRNAIVMHPDPRKVELARELQRRFPSDRHAPSGAPNVIRSGVSELTETITDDMLEALIEDADLLATMQSLALRCAMVVPLQARGRTLGAITMIGSENHERYGHDDLMLAEQIAARAALAIDTAQLFAQEQQARAEAVEEARRTEILKEATAAFGRAFSVEDVVQAMLLDGIRAAGARAGTVGIVEGDDVALVGVAGYDREDDQYWHRFGLQESLPMADAIREGTPVVLSTTAERDARYPALAGRGELADHTLVCVPMLWASRAIGAFSASYPPEATFSDKDLSLLSSIGEQCAQALERARAGARAERAISRLDAVSAASQALAQSLELEPTVETALRLGTEYLAASVGLVLRGDPRVFVHPPVEDDDPRWVREAVRKAAETPASDHPFTVDTEEGTALILRLSIASAESGILVGKEPLVDLEDPDDRRFTEEVARRIARALENARLYTDRDFVAKTLQRSLHPPVLPEMDRLEVAALFLPAEAEHGIGGDFYDVFEMADGRTAVLVGDVCGKGVEAATVTGIARRTLRALTHLGRPSELLHHLNRTLLQEDLQSRFCTAALAIVDPADRGGAQATIALAGHPPPQIVKATGEIHRVGQPGTLLGILEDLVVHDVSIELQEGDSLLLYTDGIMEKHEAAADEPVALITALRGTSWSSALELRGRIEEFVMSEAGERHDDIAVLILRVQ